MTEIDQTGEHVEEGVPHSDIAATVADMPTDYGEPGVADFPDPAFDEVPDEEEAETPDEGEPEDDAQTPEDPETPEDDEEDEPVLPPGVEQEPDEE